MSPGFAKCATQVCKPPKPDEPAHFLGTPDYASLGQLTCSPSTQADDIGVL
jgi:hypothetical protein